MNKYPNLNNNYMTNKTNKLSVNNNSQITEILDILILFIKTKKEEYKEKFILNNDSYYISSLIIILNDANSSCNISSSRNKDNHNNQNNKEIFSLLQSYVSFLKDFFSDFNEIYNNLVNENNNNNYNSRGDNTKVSLTDLIISLNYYNQDNDKEIINQLFFIIFYTDILLLTHYYKELREILKNASSKFYSLFNNVITQDKIIELEILGIMLLRKKNDNRNNIGYFISILKKNTYCLDLFCIRKLNFTVYYVKLSILNLITLNNTVNKSLLEDYFDSFKTTKDNSISITDINNNNSDISLLLDILILEQPNKIVIEHYSKLVSNGNTMSSLFHHLKSLKFDANFFKIDSNSTSIITDKDEKNSKDNLINIINIKIAYLIRLIKEALISTLFFMNYNENKIAINNKIFLFSNLIKRTNKVFFNYTNYIMDRNTEDLLLKAILNEQLLSIDTQYQYFISILIDNTYNINTDKAILDFFALNTRINELIYPKQTFVVKRVAKNIKNNNNVIYDFINSYLVGYNKKFFNLINTREFSYSLILGILRKLINYGNYGNIGNKAFTSVSVSRLSNINQEGVILDLIENHKLLISKIINVQSDTNTNNNSISNINNSNNDFTTSNYILNTFSNNIKVIFNKKEVISMNTHISNTNNTNITNVINPKHYIILLPSHCIKQSENNIIKETHYNPVIQDHIKSLSSLLKEKESNVNISKFKLYPYISNLELDITYTIRFKVELNIINNIREYYKDLSQSHLNIIMLVINKSKRVKVVSDITENTALQKIQILGVYLDLMQFTIIDLIKKNNNSICFEELLNIISIEKEIVMYSLGLLVRLKFIFIKKYDNNNETNKHNTNDIIKSNNINKQDKLSINNNFPLDLLKLVSSKAINILEIQKENNNNNRDIDNNNADNKSKDNDYTLEIINNVLDDYLNFKVDYFCNPNIIYHKELDIINIKDTDVYSNDQYLNILNIQNQESISNYDNENLIKEINKNIYINNTLKNKVNKGIDSTSKNSYLGIDLNNNHNNDEDNSKKGISDVKISQEKIILIDCSIMKIVKKEKTVKIDRLIDEMLKNKEIFNNCFSDSYKNKNDNSGIYKKIISTQVSSLNKRGLITLDKDVINF